MMKKEELAETANFVDIFDKWFDCLNVCNMSAGKVTRNPFKSSYRSGHDFRAACMKLMQIFIVCIVA